jgi:hypothetical protein
MYREKSQRSSAADLVSRNKDTGHVGLASLLRVISVRARQGPRIHPVLSITVASATIARTQLGDFWLVQSMVRLLLSHRINCRLSPLSLLILAIMDGLETGWPK